MQYSWNIIVIIYNIVYSNISLSHSSQHYTSLFRTVISVLEKVSPSHIIFPSTLSLCLLLLSRLSTFTFPSYTRSVPSFLSTVIFSPDSYSFLPPSGPRFHAQDEFEAGGTGTSHAYLVISSRNYAAYMYRRSADCEKRKMLYLARENSTST